MDKNTLNEKHRNMQKTSKIKVGLLCHRLCYQWPRSLQPLHHQAQSKGTLCQLKGWKQHPSDPRAFSSLVSLNNKMETKHPASFDRAARAPEVHGVTPTGGVEGLLQKEKFFTNKMSSSHHTESVHQLIIKSHAADRHRQPLKVTVVRYPFSRLSSLFVPLKLLSFC